MINIYLPWWVVLILIVVVVAVGFVLFLFYAGKEFFKGASKNHEAKTEKLKKIPAISGEETSEEPTEKTPEEKKKEKISAGIGIAVVLLLIIIIVLISRGCGTGYQAKHPTGYTIGDVYSCCGGSVELINVKDVERPYEYDLPSAKGHWVVVTLSKANDSDVPVKDFKEWLDEGNMTLEGARASSTSTESSFTYLEKGKQNIKEIDVFFDIDKDVAFYDAKLVVVE